MKKLSLIAVAGHIGGELTQGGELEIGSVSFGRRVRPGTLLFDFSHGRNAQRLRRGPDAVAVVTDRPEAFTASGAGRAVVRVADVGRAVWSFVEYYRSLFDIPVIGVTGTCGKTTTKEMLRHILSTKYRVNSTYKSYNAQFRHLQYLLNIDDETQACVYEMGVAAPGDLRVACRFFKPQVGVITNIGIDHLQEFDTVEDYIRAKGEFVEGLGYGGTLVLNGDDENIRKISLSRYKGNVITFGRGALADFRITGISPAGTGMDFTLRHGGADYRFSIPQPGEFNVYNAAAAIAAANTVGVGVREAGEALDSFRNVEKHFEVKQGINGSTVVDDTWSTNPTSTLAALRLLKSMAGGKKTVAVLGKMSLLGSQGDFYHFKTGRMAAEAGIDLLVVIGQEAARIGFGALHAGMPEKNVIFCSDAEDTRAVLCGLLDENTVALVKTSMLASFSGLVDSITEKLIQPETEQFNITAGE